MDEYIKKEDIEQKIQDGINNLVLGHDAIEVLGMIYEMPSADVAPVRHGRWNADETCPFCGEKSTEGLDAEKWNYWFPDFCPNCGAKMDLEG